MSDPIEAGARAWFDRQQATRRDAAGRRPNGQPWRWQDLTDRDQRGYRALVEPIVTAALAAKETQP